MSLFNIMDIASTGMSAESVRLNVSSSNLANANTVGSSEASAYHAQQPVFKAILGETLATDNFGENIPSGGVRIDGIQKSHTAIRKEYRPEHPQADKNGYIYLPNVDTISEMTNVISASRDFQRNIQLMKTTRDLMQAALKLAE